MSPGLDLTYGVSIAQGLSKVYVNDILPGQCHPALALMKATMSKILILILCLILPALAAAQDDPEFLKIGRDLYGGGSALVVSEAAVHDVFLGARDTTLAGPITGSAHVVGQNVTLTQSVAGNAYAAGQTIIVSGDVAGSATLAGQTINVGNIGRNLRAFGQALTVNGTVGGAALIAAQSVTINSTISGDVAVNTDSINFGPAAKIGGTLTIYHYDPASINVPNGVVPSARITRKTIEEWSKDAPTSVGVDRQTIWRGVLSTVVTVAVLAAILASLIPNKLARVRSTFLSRPLRSFWFGFLTLSATIGTTVVLAMSLIGLLAAPLSVVLAIVIGFAGYIVGAYALGVGLLGLIGRAEPGAWLERALAAAVGAVVIAAIGLVPFVGWLVVLVVTLTGIGSLCIVLFRPSFYSDSTPVT